MFERYTERARRVLFFARYEASQMGSISIETEQLLLGLMREGKGLTSRIFARSHVSLEDVRREIEGRTVFREKVSTSVEIPFSAETKRVLGFAADEADRLHHGYIGTEHLLLGLLREERSVAATILMDKGMRLQAVRDDVLQLLNDPSLRVVEGGAPRHRGFVGMLPHYLPSRTVHITYSQSPSTEGPAIAPGAHLWFALGKTLTQIAAFAWGSEESRIRLASGQLDGDVRYDFTIVLPSTDSPEIIPRLLRDAIERDFNVEVTPEGDDPPTLMIKSRTDLSA